MRQEGLDPKGRIELARMLSQIGFPTEAIAEYLMAARMYEERGNTEQALKLYEKVLGLDENNQSAKRGLYKLKPRSEKDIEDIVTKLGFASSTSAPPAEAATTPVPRPPAEPAVTHEVTQTPLEPEPRQIIPATEPDSQVAEEVVELAGKGLEEFLASIMPLLQNTAEELKKRRELASFFGEEGLWSEAFFEAQPAYLQKPSVDKLNELLSLLSHSEENEEMITFLLTESFSDRKPALNTAVLEALVKTYEDAGQTEDAEKTRVRLQKLSGNKVNKKQNGSKIIKDVPKLSKEDKDDDNQGKKKSPDSIQFV